MKYLLLLLSILLVACSSVKKTKLVETKPVEVPINPTIDSVSYEYNVEKIQMEPKYSVIEETKPTIEKTPINLTTKTPKIKIVKVKNKYINSTTKKGNVAYHIPTTMVVRNTYQVTLVISKTTVNIYEDMEGVVKTTTIPITETMEVNLVDPSPVDDKTFSIVPDNNAEQLIEDGNEVTKWSWNVTPLKSGGANLKIVVSIIKNGHKKETVYTDNIHIKTNLVKTIPLFLEKYWQWLLTTLVIPFGVWLYNKRKKKDGE